MQWNILANKRIEHSVTRAELLSKERLILKRLITNVLNLNCWVFKLRNRHIFSKEKSLVCKFGCLRVSSCWSPCYKASESIECWKWSWNSIDKALDVKITYPWLCLSPYLLLKIVKYMKCKVDVINRKVRVFIKWKVGSN